MKTVVANNARLLKIMILFLCLIWFTISLFACNAFADVPQYILEGECYAMTSSEVIGDGPYTIYDYMDAITNKKGEIYENDQLNTELLYQIVPARLLRETCSYAHRGKAYSFYVHTVSNTVEVPYASEVVIIPHKFELKSDIAEASLKLSVFSQGYYTKESVVTGKDFTYCAGFETSKFYLRDVQFYTGVKNIGQPNYGDDNYSKANDTGPILSQTRINYNEALQHEQNKSIIPLTKFGIDALFSYLPLPYQISNLYKGLKTFEEWKDMFDYYRGSPNVQNIESNNNNERNNEVNITSFQTRHVQKNNDKPFYERFITLAPHEYGRSPVIDKNGYMELIMKLDDSYPASEISIGAMFNIIMRTGDKDYVINNSGTTSAYTKNSSQNARFSCRYDKELVA